LHEIRQLAPAVTWAPLGLGRVLANTPLDSSAEQGQQSGQQTDGREHRHQHRQGDAEGQPLQRAEAKRRLERAGYLASEWSTVSGRKRRTYRLTSAGQKMLAAEKGEWDTFRAVMESVLHPGGATS
jgi:hypothetical protein